MSYFYDYYKNLSPYKEFNPKAFIGDDKVSQELCNFILVLSLAYNDYKYYNLSYNMILKSEPKKIERNPACGEYFGIKLHLFRLNISFIHELLELIERNKDLTELSFFKEIIRVLSPKARKSWKIVIDTISKESKLSSKSNLLARIRNKVAFHYDLEELFSGYKKGFFDNGEILENACISLGSYMGNVRFYFADLAIQAYLLKKLDITNKDFMSKLEKIMVGVNIALYEICTKFIQKRGFAWKNPVK